jgi:glycosyltransferase involved in cell wall biosynthesis
MNSKSKVKDSPLISVVVPVALGRGPLDTLLSWVENALLHDLHLVIVLDGTSKGDDESLKRLATLSGYSNLVILNGLYGSPGAARNAGLKLATGRWVFFWDSDDLPNIQNAKSMVLEAERTNSQFAVGSFEWRILQPAYKAEQHLLNGSLEENLLRVGLNPGIWRFAFRRTQIIYAFSTLQMAEDQIFILQNADFSKNHLAYQDIVYYYHTGISTQQTAVTGFIPDLTESIEVTSRLLRKQVGSRQKFLTRIFLVRQIFTGLKHGSRKTRLEIALKFIRIMISLGLIGSILLATDAIKVLRIKKLQKEGGVRIVVPLTGGLGNQLFQLAIALSLAKGNSVLLNQSIGRPRTNKDGLPEIASFEFPQNVTLGAKKSSNFVLIKLSGLMLRSGINPRPIEKFYLWRLVLKLLWRIVASLSLLMNVKPIAGSGVGYFEVPKIERKTLLYGYFQSYRWPESVKLEMQKLRPRISRDALDRLKVESDIERPLVVHIRLGDYRNEEDFGLLDEAYFLTSTQEMWSTKRFGRIWLFSDEPSEAIKYFPANLTPHIRIMSEFQDSTALTFESMRLGHGYVISNSTFSWWGAFLSYHPNPSVIAPSPWFKNLAEPIDLVPPDWFRRET